MPRITYQVINSVDAPEQLHWFRASAGMTIVSVPLPVIPAPLPVIPAPLLVIPAQVGIQSREYLRMLALNSH